MHPVKNLLSGELARALLIQVLQMVLSGFAFLLEVTVPFISVAAGPEAKTGY